MNKPANATTAIYTAIVLLYGLFLYLIYKYSGLVTINEAEKYITAAKALLNGNVKYTFTQHLFYSGYILFISPFFAAGGIAGVVIAQAVANILAALCLKKSVDIILPDNSLSLLAALLFLFSYPIQYWTLTLYSDNFFVVLICISLYYTVKQNTNKEEILLTILLLLLIFSRPPGIFISLVFGCYYLYNNGWLSISKTIWAGAISLIVIFTVLFFNPVETKGYIKPIAAGCIIVEKPDYDVPEFNKIDKSTLSEAYIYLYKQYGFAKLTALYFAKIKSFYTLTRPYYSKLNNSILMLHYLLYFFALLGVILLRNKRKFLILLLTNVVLISNLTGLTYNEWHYRFTLAILPFLILLTTIAIEILLNKTKGFPSGQ